MKDEQSNSQLQSQQLESELGFYKESNKKLQIENNKEKYFSDLINTKLKDHIRSPPNKLKNLKLREINSERTYKNEMKRS